MAPSELLAFRHALMREVAYQLQLPGDRARLHKRAITAIEALIPPAEISTVAAELADHARAAGDPRETRYLREAAAHAGRHFRHSDACDLLGRLLAHPRVTAREAFTARLSRASSLQALGRFGEARRDYDACAESAPGADARSEALEGAATCAGHLGDPRRACGALEGIAAEARRRGQPRAEAIARGNLSNFYVSLGRLAEAGNEATRALELFEASGDRHHATIARGNLARLRHECGLREEALSDLARAAREFGALGDKVGESRALSSLGVYLAETGRFEEGLSASRRAVAVAARSGSPAAQASAARNLAILLSQLQGRERETEEALLRAIDLSRECGLPLEEGTLCNNYANLLTTLGREAEVFALRERALALARQTGHLRGEAYALGNLGLTLRRRGRLAEAADHLDRAVALFEKLAAPALIASWRLEAADLCLFRGDLDGARRRRAEAARAARLADVDPSLAAPAELTLLRMDLAEGRPEEAMARLERMRSHFGGLPDGHAARRVLVRADGLLARAAETRFGFLPEELRPPSAAADRSQFRRRAQGAPDRLHSARR